MAAKAGVTASSHTKLRPVPISSVRLGDGFWKPRMDINSQHSIPKLLAHLEEHGVVDNFAIVSGRKKTERKGPYFTDSDLYKWMEAAAFDLQTYDSPGTRRDLDRIIDEVVAAQGEDGYLNTYFQGDLFDQRFRNLPVEHELYCAGHLFQAAVAHHRATGSDKLLAAACRFADYLHSVFGYDKRQGAAGHPEIEMALVELYRTTGEKRYLELAEYLMTQLGFRKMRSLGGHAVRALYTCCGGADYYAESGDAEFKTSIEGLWEDLVAGKMYITGGVGARYAGESIGEPYELPNLRAYAETCAAIANVMFNYRMLSIYGDARYADVMERALYNGVISGVSLDGSSYFYTNPLTDTGTRERQEWFGCTCCPTNMVRTLASLPGYFYATSSEGIWVHLYDSSHVEHVFEDGVGFALEQSTRYPWDGNVDLTIDLREPREFTLFLRIPGWCGSAAAAVNGVEVTGETPGEYLAIRRMWRGGDSVHLNLGMPVTLQECDPRVRENLCSVAVQRGPVVYCAESADNPDISIIDLELGDADFASRMEPDKLGGVVTLKGRGLSADPKAPRGALYREAGSRSAPLKPVPIELIPYYAWANRGKADMTLWMPRRRS